MPTWKRALSDGLKVAVHDIDRVFDRVSRAVKVRMGWINPVMILPYRGFGNPQRLFFQGRVLEENDVGSPQDNDTWRENLLNMYRRFRTSEIPGVRVQARFQGHTWEATTDDEGYYSFLVEPSKPLDRSQLWHDVELELLDGIGKQQDGVKATGRVLVPSADSDFGVISDMDDTVIRSHATDLWKIARITFLNNARTRMPLPGVSAFYHALYRGPDGKSRNPFFYVSSSAWNLYDLFRDFLDLNDIPAGPILLRDLGIDRERFIAGSHDHKLEKVERIFAACPETRFILIGDAGQDDPRLYRQVVLDYPGRVLAIYIHEVPWKDRRELVEPIIHEVAVQGVDMLLIEDTHAAARHAAEHGYISPAAMDEIDAARRRDTDPASPLAEAV